MTRSLRNKSRRAAALWAMVILLVTGSAVPVSAASVGLVLGAQNFYQLLAKPLVAGGGFQFPNPGVDVSLNPCPLPPGGTDANTSLDLTNPGSPRYTQPGVGQVFTEINWGMNLGFDGVSYSLPSPEFGAPLDDPAFSFFAQGTNSDGGLMGDLFRIDFQIAGPAGPGDPGEFVSLNPCPLPPGADFPGAPFPGDSSIQGAFNLRFQFAGDPILDFQLFDVTPGHEQQFGFAPIPEPTAALVFGTALLVIGVSKRQRSDR